MIKYEDLVKDLKAKKFKPVYLLMGEEPFYIDRLCDFFENFVIEPEQRDFNQAVLYGRDTTVDEIVANAKQFPFGSPQRLVIVKEAKDVKNIVKKGKKDDEDSQESGTASGSDGASALTNYVQNPSPSTILVICYKYGKLTAKQCKPFEKEGVVYESVGVKDYQLPEWIQQRVARAKLQINPEVAALIAETIGNDLPTIHSQLEKLKVILPPNSVITRDVVEKYIGISKEYNIFELQDALVKRNAQQAYKIALNFGQHLKENPNVKTIATLFGYYHKMLQYHLSPDKSSETQVRIFGKFFLNDKVRGAMSYTIPQLTRIISILREYDVKSKGVDSSSDDAELLKEMFYKIIH